ncbi:unnamed protein product [Rotaria sp. Silwood1]|nr:unnamed protein product [Rotaria sp. Silwood1]
MKFITKDKHETITLRPGQEAAEDDREHGRQENEHRYEKDN